jgi:ABC-2 type transport system permease protein
MPTGAAVRTLAVAEHSLRSALVGGRGIALALGGLALPLLVLGIAAARVPGIDLLATEETLYSTLLLPVVLLLVALVLGVGAFRGELEEDTLVYPLGRTLPRGALAVGKYLGVVAAALLVLLPSSVIATVIAASVGSGPTVPTTGLLAAVALVTTLAVVAYAGIFLLLGLLTRYALVIGLLYGFLWETFIPLIPGPVRDLSVIYYLRGTAGAYVPNGALSNGVGAMDPTGVVVATFLLALAVSVLVTLWLSYAEIRPSAAPA